MGEPLTLSAPAPAPPPPPCRCSHPPHTATDLVRAAVGLRWYCADTAAQLRALLAARDRTGAPR